MLRRNPPLPKYLPVALRKVAAFIGNVGLSEIMQFARALGSTISGRVARPLEAGKLSYLRAQHIATPYDSPRPSNIHYKIHAA